MENIVLDRPRIPSTAQEYLEFCGDFIRILMQTGYCAVPGKVYGETSRQYKVVSLAGDKVVRRRYAKTESVHFVRCKYCPPDG